MLKFMEKNKKELVTFGLYGLIGAILVRVVKYIIKVANHHPKVFWWISFIIFTLLCISGFLFIRNGNTKFAIICIGAILAISSLCTNSRK